MSRLTNYPLNPPCIGQGLLGGKKGNLHKVALGKGRHLLETVVVFLGPRRQVSFFSF